MHYESERNFGCRVSEAWTYRGLKTVILENEVLRVVVLADKGADVYQLVHKPTDTDFMWRSPWGVRDPRRFLPTTGSAMVWLDMYEGGWQTIAPTGGPPGSYRGADIGLHCEASLMPWDVQIVDDSAGRAAARFWVRTYRTPFYIEKTLSLEAGSPALTVEEAVVNEAEEDAECVWGQHITLGAPFLGPSCRLDMAGAGVLILGEGTADGERRLAKGEKGRWPHVPGARGGSVDLRRFPDRSERLIDLAALHDLAEGWYAVTNTEMGVGFGFVFPKETFRFLWYWQVFGGGTGYPWYRRTYNVGLEPFTSLPGGAPMPGSEARTSLTLAPGERREATMRAVAFRSKAGVRAIGANGRVATAD